MMAPIINHEKPIPIKKAPHQGKGANRPMESRPISSAKCTPTAIPVVPVNNVFR